MLLQQKVRWAGKWKKQKGWGVLLAPLLFMVHVLFLWTSINMFWNPFLPLGVILFIAAHGYLFYKLSGFFGYKLPFFSFLIANFAYSAYAIAVGVLTLKRRSYIWKGRKIDVR